MMYITATVHPNTTDLPSQRLVEDPPEHPNASLTGLFDVLSHMYPQVYYKPVFACAASSKEFTVINFISVLAAIARFQKDFWFRSAEMISVALMSDGAGQVKGKGKEKAVDELDLGWGVERFGQNVLLVELAGKLQTIRRLKEDSKVSPPSFRLPSFLFFAPVFRSGVHTSREVCADS